VLLLDADGKERVRFEGYLSNQDFTAALMNGLGRMAFVQKRYADAERWYGNVMTRYGDSHFAAEAMYWRAVSPSESGSGIKAEGNHDCRPMQRKSLASQRLFGCEGGKDRSPQSSEFVIGN
jgi:hypothetical protein